jgi:hypothetical protein
MLILWQNLRDEVIPDEEVEVRRGAYCLCPAQKQSPIYIKALIPELFSRPIRMLLTWLGQKIIRQILNSSKEG